MTRRRLRCCLPLLLPACFAATPVAEGEPPRRLEPDLLPTLDAAPDGRAFVIVILADADRLAEIADRAQRRLAVTQRRSAILQRLSRDEFTPAHSFSQIAAITGRATRSAVLRLAAMPEVERIGLDQPLLTPQDELSEVPPTQSAAARAASTSAAAAAIIHGYDGTGMTVAVIDSGIDTDHPDFAGALAPGAWHILGQGTDVGPGAEDVTGHGTAVAGVIAARGVVAPPGLAPASKILAVQTIDPTNFGWLSDTAAAIEYLLAAQPAIPNPCAINISLVSFALYFQCPCDSLSASNQLLAISIKAAWIDGIPTFVASGNDSQCGWMASPACIKYANAAAALKSGGGSVGPTSGNSSMGAPDGDASPAALEIAAFSDRSRCNDLAAPGENVPTTRIGGGMNLATGTSFAAPYCAGVAALMAQKGQRGCMPLTPDQTVAIMKSTGILPIDACTITTPHPIAVQPEPAVQAVAIRGDVNGDGWITTSDVPFFIDVLLNRDALPAHQTAADLDCNGMADGRDAPLFIIRLTTR